MPIIVDLIDRVLNDIENENNINKVKSEVNKLMKDFPLYAW